MKTIKAYQFKDLEKDVQRVLQNQVINEIVDYDLSTLGHNLDENQLTEEEYYKILGCSKYYAETTGWFVPSCYYDNNKLDVLRRMAFELKTGLYTKTGKIIDML